MFLRIYFLFGRKRADVSIASKWGNENVLRPSVSRCQSSLTCKKEKFVLKRVYSRFKSSCIVVDCFLFVLCRWWGWLRN